MAAIPYTRSSRPFIWMAHIYFYAYYMIGCRVRAVLIGIGSSYIDPMLCVVTWHQGALGLPVLHRDVHAARYGAHTRLSERHTVDIRLQVRRAAPHPIWWSACTLRAARGPEIASGSLLILSRWPSHMCNDDVCAGCTIPVILTDYVVSVRNF